MDFTSYGFDSTLHSLFRRGCVECPDETPSCPNCADNEICTQVSATCTQCASRACIAAADSGAVNTGMNVTTDDGPNVGAIAGGVIGGVIAIAVVTYLIWRFCIKNRRTNDDDDLDLAYEEKDNGAYAASRATRASTHTVASIASTVMTRASNVIQIAFIPGIMDRSGHEEVPPVPSIPLQHSNVMTVNSGPPSPYQDSPHNSPFSPPPTSHSPQNSPLFPQQDHYFMPADIRDSTWSGYTDDTQSIRSSVMRHSLTPSLARQSYASTVYRNDASVQPMPAQTAYRGRANVVQLNNRPSQGSGSDVPAVPSINLQQYAGAGSSHDGSTVSRNAAAMSSNAGASGSQTSMSSRGDDRDRLTVAITEATRRASKSPTHGGLGALRREQSPFSDENAVSR